MVPGRHTGTSTGDQEDHPVKSTGRALRLSIFIDETDHWHHKPLYAEIVHRAHKAGLAGASVFRGIEGYGATSRIHTTHVFRLSEDLPLLIIIVDTEDRVRGFLPQLDELDISGLVALDEVGTVQYTQPEHKHTHWWSAG
jgi:PII-like signaling protein